MNNFNDLPTEIHNLIFSFNRAEQIKIEKRKFAEVIDQIEEVAETPLQIYYNQEEYNSDLTFGSAMVECVVVDSWKYDFNFNT